MQVYAEEREANRGVFEEKRKERLKQVGYYTHEKSRTLFSDTMQAKLRLVLDCQWDGAVSIKSSSTSAGSAVRVWEPSFLVVQVNFMRSEFI